MPRKYYRKRYVKKDKYSVENRIVQSNTINNWEHRASTGDFASTYQTDKVIVPNTDVEGMRKCKHFTLTFTAGSNHEMRPLYYALVYVPEGYSPNWINLPKYDNIGVYSPYEPNQFVISQGLLDFSGGPLRIRSPLSRNLNSGDSIHLLLAFSEAWGTPDATGIEATVSYAISYQ